MVDPNIHRNDEDIDCVTSDWTLKGREGIGRSRLEISFVRSATITTKTASAGSSDDFIKI